jgi:hypothetical protein
MGIGIFVSVPECALARMAVGEASFAVDLLRPPSKKEREESLDHDPYMWRPHFHRRGIMDPPVRFSDSESVRGGTVFTFNLHVPTGGI